MRPDSERPVRVALGHPAAPVDVGDTDMRSRLRGKFIAQTGMSQMIIGGQTMERVKAPENGVYQLGRNRFRVRAGALYPAEAEFFPDGPAIPEGESEREVQLSDLPKYYLDYQDKQAQAGLVAYPKFVDETRAEFEARIKGYPDEPIADQGSETEESGETGPEETTENSGPAETA